MKISAIVLTKNEEKNIKNCLESLAWCDEIIVIDDNSTDNTVKIAEKFKAKIYSHSLDNNFSSQRNFGLKKASNEWVLFVDADERVTDNLALELSTFNFQLSTLCNGYFIKRVDSMWGKILKYGETNVNLIRLAKKEKGEWQGQVHEIWKVRGKIGKLENHLLHFPHQTMSEFLQEINYYSSLRAEELYNQKVKVKWWHIIAYPKAKFVQDYFLKLGILDGVRGLIVAILMSLHSFLVRGKLWLLWDRTK